MVHHSEHNSPMSIMDEHNNNHNNKHYMHMPQMHSMAFHFGSDELILFNFWKINSTFGLITSSFVLIIFCFLMEFIRWFRLYKKKQRWSETQAEISDSIFKRIDLTIISDGLLHAIQLILSYSLMLVFMTFNVWLCGVIITGEVIARLVFTICFPQLERINEIISISEPCCG